MSPPATPSAPREDIDFEALPWNLNCPDAHSYIHLTTKDAWGEYESGLPPESIKKYSTNPLQLYPSTTSLNYGTTIWEGLKCYRKADGSVAIFRPDMNFSRFSRGAGEMCLPSPSFDLFMKAIQTVIQANSELIPPHGDGMKLYVRPMLLGRYALLNCVFLWNLLYNRMLRYNSTIVTHATSFPCLLLSF